MASFSRAREELRCVMEPSPLRALHPEAHAWVLRVTVAALLPGSPCGNAANEGCGAAANGLRSS